MVTIEKLLSHRRENEYQPTVLTLARLFETYIRERVYNTALLYVELPSFVCAVALSLVDFHNFTEYTNVSVSVPNFMENIRMRMRGQCIPGRPSFPPTLIMADGLGVSLL